MLSIIFSLAVAIIVAFVGLALVALLAAVVSFKLLTMFERRALQKTMNKDAEDLARSLETAGISFTVTEDGDLAFTQNAPTDAEGDEEGITEPELGHYLKKCTCPDCANAAKSGGIPVDNFIDAVATVFYKTPTATEDGEMVFRATTPIVSCTCGYCREARADGRPEMTIEEAMVNLEKLNEKLGYAL